MRHIIDVSRSYMTCILQFVYVQILNRRRTTRLRQRLFTLHYQLHEFVYSFRRGVLVWTKLGFAPILGQFKLVIVDPIVLL